MKLDTDRIVNTNAASLLQAGEAAILAGDSSFDLSSVQRLDSSAVALLLAWRRTARAQGRQLELRGLPASLHSLATLYGVESLITGGPSSQPLSQRERG
jgi:phospholipid transport system transporter-binding protein